MKASESKRETRQPIIEAIKVETLKAELKSELSELQSEFTKSFDEKLAQLTDLYQQINAKLAQGITRAEFAKLQKRHEELTSHTKTFSRQVQDRLNWLGEREQGREGKKQAKASKPKAELLGLDFSPLFEKEEEEE